MNRSRHFVRAACALGASSHRALALVLLAAWLGACAADDPDDPNLRNEADARVDGAQAGASPEAGSSPDLDAGSSDGGSDLEAGSADAAPSVDVPDGAADAGPVGPEPRRLAGITAEHNAARARAVTSTPLSSLSWSDEIAAVAQSYADKLAGSCANALTHSAPTERRNWGENLAAYTITGGKGTEPNGSPRDVVVLWESELTCYTLGPFQSGVNATCTEACKTYGGCGHLTQILWRKTQRLGCGVADCIDGKTRKSYWVCNYDPAGNVTGQLPY